MFKNAIFNIALCSVLLFACKQKKTEPLEAVQTENIVFIATNYPLQLFAQHIVRDFAQVKFLAPSDEDPAFWKPSVDQILELQAADLVFLNGAGYESWLSTLSLPESKLINTSSSFKDQYLESDEEVTHSHGGEAEHSHKSKAFTVWLNLELALKQAESIKNTLVANYPEQKDLFTANYDALALKLLALNNSLKSVTQDIEGEYLLYSHPVYQYLEQGYNMAGTSMHWEPNAEISKSMWHDLEHVLNHQKKQWMIWENTPNAQSVERLEKVGIKSIVFDPCGNRPVEGDFFTVMAVNIEELRKIAKP